ncbi:MAG: 2'-5' RNA ligase family protein [Rothia sp. (in: high G+C Gram-positive bacteria)]|nr:2'-5' RNA ligase family protein [Rothia sp. (in: high G+C Gram-positive bacteria)]
MTKSSPTLVPGEQYISVLAPVPDALSGRIFAWQQQHHVAHARRHSHITVHIAAQPGQQQIQKVAQKLGEQSSFIVGLGEPASFLPETSVSFLPVNQGAYALDMLREVSSACLGPSSSPFEYIPHLTLAYQLEESALRDSLEEFADLPQELLTFEVERVGIFRYTGSEWELLQEVPLQQLPSAHDEAITDFLSE